jgi:plastocyanin
MNTSFVRAPLAAAFALSFLAACGGSGGGVSGSSSVPGSPDSGCTSRSAATDQYLKADSSTKTVTVVLDITGFSYDGYSNGQMTVCVPQGWKVTAQCTNKTNVPHSCAVVENATATSPAFSGAATKDPVGGLQPGDSETFTFTADRTGQFRIVCLVPGHEDAGMWDRFNVTSAGAPLIAT